jgi:acetoin utilization deacetylase AcuC-like enzyme
VGIYLRHPSSFDHDTGAHPESARRLIAIEEALSDRDWLGLDLVEAPAAERDQILRVHTPAHVDAIEELSARGGGNIDLDTVASAGSWEAALHAAGGAVRGVDLLLGDQKAESGKRERFAFCGTRPPGHHAERGQAMGFCLFNNAAIAAAHALSEHRAERVLILDWDVHHGNGTEEIFYGSGEVLYVSIHQSPLWPGTGAAGDLGRGEGEGYTVNLPVAPGAGPELYLSLLRHVVAPIAREWRPGLIIVSAGYDAHRDDPLAQCELDERAYSEMSATIRELGGEISAPVLVCLEGGYAIEALAASVVSTLEALSDSAEPIAVGPEAAEPYRKRLAATWPVLAP